MSSQASHAQPGDKMASDPTPAFPLPSQPGGALLRGASQPPAKKKPRAARGVAAAPGGRAGMSRFAGQRSRPWVGMVRAGAPPEPAADVARDDAAAASSMRGAGGLGTDPSTNANAISFGFAATAVLVSMFLLMAIFEHLIKPGMASSSSPGSHDDDDEDDENGEGRRHSLGLPPGRLNHQLDASPSPDKLSHSPKVEPVAAAADLTVLMPGQRYPTFLAQPAPLAPCPREGVHWPPHDHEHRPSFVPP